VSPPDRPAAASWWAQLDTRALVLGAAVAMAIALPAALAAEVLVDDDDSAFGPPLFALVLVGFGLGGFVAALVAYVIIQGVGVVRRVIADETVSPAGIVFAALLASSTGLLGAFLANRRARSRR